MWDLPGPGLEPLSPSLAGGFLTTAPPEKSSLSLLRSLILHFSSVFCNIFFCCWLVDCSIWMSSSYHSSLKIDSPPLMRLGQDRRALMNGISAFIKEGPRESSLILSSMGRHRKDICELGSSPQKTESLTTLATWPQTTSFQNCEKLVSVVYKRPSLWYFVKAVWTELG